MGVIRQAESIAQRKDIHCTDAARTEGGAVTSAAACRILCCVLLRTLREDDASIEHVGENSEQLAQNALDLQAVLAGRAIRGKICHVQRPIAEAEPWRLAEAQFESTATPFRPPPAL